MRATIISIGSELVTGQCVDTNAAWLAAELTRAGMDVTAHVTVGDGKREIAEAMSAALASADLVVCTGGLGPTPDDRARQALARAGGAALEEHPAAVAHLQAFFDKWERPFTQANRVQALIPEGCDAIANDHGTAPGIAYEGESARLFALPGVPNEMKAMFLAAVAPMLARNAAGGCTRAGRLVTFGMPEAQVGELLVDLMAEGRNPAVGTTASEAVISVRIVARADDEPAATQLVEADAGEVRRRLGRAVFGEDNDRLEDSVARLLTERGLTVSTAESCTGGLIATRLTDVPGSSAYFLRGVVAYANEAKTALLGLDPELIEADGAVSEPVAREMARGCRIAAGSDLALATTGIAGPGGAVPPDKPVGLVYIALACESGVEVRRLLVGEHLSREQIRDRSCKSALNLLRLHLLRQGAL